MYYIMSAHDFIGPSIRFSKGFPVATPATKIINNVMVSPDYAQDNGTIPLGNHTLQGRRVKPIFSIPIPKDTGPRGDKASEGIPSGQYMATR